jgi:hypothetical protein
MLRVVKIKGYNVNNFDRRSRKTLMHYAIKTKNMEMIRFLITCGIDLTHLDSRQKSYSDHAGNNDLIKNLINQD